MCAPWEAQRDILLRIYQTMILSKEPLLFCRACLCKGVRRQSKQSHIAVLGLDVNADITINGTGVQNS